MRSIFLKTALIFLLVTYIVRAGTVYISAPPDGDPTAVLQDAIDSGADTVIVSAAGGNWEVDPIFLSSDSLFPPGDSAVQGGRKQPSALCEGQYWPLADERRCR